MTTYNWNVSQTDYKTATGFITAQQSTIQSLTERITALEGART